MHPTEGHYMEELLEQIENSANNRSYMIGLYTALSIPDICAALQSENGQTKPSKYKNWFDRWVAPKYNNFFSGEQCYAFRCGVVHQGRAQHEKLGYERIIFFDPESPNVFHNNILDNALNIDVRIFCQDMVDAAREWLNHMSENPTVHNNLQNLLQRRPNGIPPYVVGIDAFG